MSTGNFMASRNAAVGSKQSVTKRAAGIVVKKAQPAQKKKKVMPELGPNPELLFEEKDDIETEFVAEEEAAANAELDEGDEDDDCVEEPVDYSGTTDEEDCGEMEEEEDEIEVIVSKKPATKVSFKNCFIF